jgi:UDP-2,3-diacylglucosamine pyrophosphatase LpxH
MSKWIAIGDIHGRDTWKPIVNSEIDNVDRIIFVGDYFDSFHIPMQTQISNFLDILELKRKYPDRVVLLIGNHDYHYMRSVKQTYSGFNSVYSLQIESDCILPAIRDGLLKMCHIEGDYLFSHAGFTKTWLDSIAEIDPEVEPIDTAINYLFFYKPNLFRFQSSYKLTLSDSYGDNHWQGPLWVRPASLKAARIDGWKQVVGHTEKYSIESSDGLYFIDALDNGYYLHKDDITDEPVVKKIR